MQYVFHFRFKQHSAAVVRLLAEQQTVRSELNLKTSAFHPGPDFHNTFGAWQSTFFLILTLSPQNKLPSSIVLVCFNFQSAKCRSNLLEMLYECQTTSIQMRRRATRRLIRIQPITLVVFGGLRVKTCIRRVIYVSQYMYHVSLYFFTSICRIPMRVMIFFLLFSCLLVYRTPTCKRYIQPIHLHKTKFTLRGN